MDKLVLTCFYVDSVDVWSDTDDTKADKVKDYVIYLILLDLSS